MTARPFHHIPTLDGLRAVAILLVVCSHSIDHVDNPTAVDIGHLGVLLFFALSGYLITTLLVQEFRATGAISLRDFYTRRAFRILPPAMAYLMLMWILNA